MPTARLRALLPVIGRLALSHHGPAELERCIRAPVPICRRCAVILTVAATAPVVASGPVARSWPTAVLIVLILGAVIEGWLDVRRATHHRPWRQTVVTAVATVSLLALRERMGPVVTVGLVALAIPALAATTWSATVRRARSEAPVAYTVV